MSALIEKVIVNKEDLEQLANSVRTAKNESGSYQWDTLKTSAIEIIGAGSNKALDTCTVSINYSNGATIQRIYYNTVESDGSIKSVMQFVSLLSKVTLQNVVCNTYVTIYGSNADFVNTSTFCEEEAQSPMTSLKVVRITASKGETATINYKNSSGGGALD